MTVDDLEKHVRRLEEELIEHKARIVELESNLDESRSRQRGLVSGIHRQLQLWVVP